VGGSRDPRGIAFADMDGDGDLDFAVGAKRSRNWLVRNNFNAGNWVKVQLVSPEGQLGAFGAKTFIYPAGEAGGTLLAMRESRSNQGYLGQDDPVLHFGLGSHTSVDIVVHFLDGTVVTQSDVIAGQTILISDDETPPGTPTSTPTVTATPPPDFTDFLYLPVVQDDGTSRSESSVSCLPKH
jgi:hypothetical protein